MSDQDQGLYAKYRAFKIEGVNEIMPGVPIRVAGIPVEEVTDPFFLLKLNDPHGRAAIKAYADSCESEFPILAADLRRALHNVKEKAS